MCEMKNSKNSSFHTHPDDGQITTKSLRDHFRCTILCTDGNSVCCWLCFYHALYENADPDTSFMKKNLKKFKSILDTADHMLMQRESLSWYSELESSITFLKNNRTATLSSFTRISFYKRLFSISIGKTNEQEINSTLEIVSNIMMTSSKIYNHSIYKAVPFDVEKNNGVLAKLHFGDGFSYFFEINFYEHFTLNSAFEKFFNLFNANSSGCILVGHNVSGDIITCERYLKFSSNKPFKFPEYIDTAFLWCRFGGWSLDGFGSQIMQTYITGGGMIKKWKLSATSNWSNPWTELPLYCTIYNIGDLKAVYNIFLAFFVINLPRIFPAKDDFIHVQNLNTSYVPTMFYQILIYACKNQSMNYPEYQKESNPTLRKFAAEHKSTLSSFYKEFCLFWNDNAICINKPGWKINHRIVQRNSFLKLYSSINNSSRI